MTKFEDLFAHRLSGFRFFHLLWHNPFRLMDIVSKRFDYFKQLIAGYKVQRKETTEMEESMIYDYLVKMKSSESSSEFTHFSGIVISHTAHSVFS